MIPIWDAKPLQPRVKTSPATTSVGSAWPLFGRFLMWSMRHSHR